MAATQLYEMRSYRVADGRMDDELARGLACILPPAEGGRGLFDRYGIPRPVGLWRVLSGAQTSRGDFSLPLEQRGRTCPCFRDLLRRSRVERIASRLERGKRDRQQHGRCPAARAAAGGTLPLDGIYEFVRGACSFRRQNRDRTARAAVRRRPVRSARCSSMMATSAARCCAGVAHSLPPRRLGWDAMKTIYRIGVAADAITIEHWPSWAAFDAAPPARATTRADIAYAATPVEHHGDRDGRARATAYPRRQRPHGGRDCASRGGSSTRGTVAGGAQSIGAFTIVHGDDIPACLVLLRWPSMQSRAGRPDRIRGERSRARSASRRAGWRVDRRPFAATERLFRPAIDGHGRCVSAMSAHRSSHHTTGDGHEYAWNDHKTIAAVAWRRPRDSAGRDAGMHGAQQPNAKIGLFLELTGGSASTTSEASQFGVELAVQEINAAGGIGGRKLAARCSRHPDRSDGRRR